MLNGQELETIRPDITEDIQFADIRHPNERDKAGKLKKTRIILI